MINYGFKQFLNIKFKDIHDAKNACDHLSGFNVCNRYLVVLYYNPTRAFKKLETEKKEAELVEIRKRMGIKK
jgi:pre-mRNA branch site protein p14